MFVESLTIAGFPQLDDRSFRFEPTINFLPDHPACEILDWFLNGHSQLPDWPARFSETAYAEVRLRSDGVNDYFAELRGAKSRSVGEKTWVRLHRDMVRPDKVLVDGKHSLRLDKFRFEMEQLGLAVRTASWPTSLNVIGPQEMAERVLNARSLWSLVSECCNVDFLRMQAGREQNFKMAFRQKSRNAIQHELGDKIAEIKDKIESSRVFRKLQKTLDAMTRGVVEKELRTFWQVTQQYESQLCSLVEQRELLSEKEEALRKSRDREQSVTNSVLELLSENIRLGIGEADCTMALMATQAKPIDFNSALQQKIETLLNKLQDTVGSVLDGNSERFRTYEQLVQNEYELELAENCLHLQYLPAKEKTKELKKVADTLVGQLEVAKAHAEELRKSIEELKKSVQGSRNTLAIEDRNDGATKIRAGRSLIEQLAETAQKDLEEKMNTFLLNKQLLENETAIVDSVKLSECLTLESIQALAHLRHVIGTTDDDILRSNFVGFAYKHLKFNDSTVTKLILPLIEHIYTLAIFRTEESIQKLQNLLPRKHSYNLLATETFRPDEIPTPAIPNLHPLADYLVDSPLKPILSRVLHSFYCTNEPYSEVVDKLEPGTITVICIDDEITIDRDGLIVCGHPPCVEFLADTIVNCVKLSVDVIDIRQQLRVQRNTSAEYQRAMEQIWTGLVTAAGRDSFERFASLKQSDPTWSALPSSLEQLSRQQLALINQQCRVASWTTLLDRITQQEFNFRQEDATRKARVAALRGRFQADQKAFDRQVAQLKCDLWSLRELLVQLESLRDFGFDPELHKLLVTYWREYKDRLSEALVTVGNELETCDHHAVSDELDHLRRESVQVHMQMLTVNDRLQELDRHYQVLRVEAKERLKNTKPGKSICKEGTLQKLYESKRKLYAPDIQPPYKEDQLRRFKLKLDLLQDQERWESEFRTTHITNLMMPSVEKLSVRKLRLVTQMLGTVPGLLKQSGRVRLNFEYDRTKCVPEEEGLPEMNLFSLQNTVGLSIKFVGHHPAAQPDHPLLDDPALLNLLFFVCFLSVRGCKLIILGDCFTDLPNVEKLEFFNLLATVAKNTQLFVGETSHE